MEFWFEQTKKFHTMIQPRCLTKCATQLLLRHIFTGFENPQVQGSIPVATINGFLMIAYFGKIKKN